MDVEKWLLPGTRLWIIGVEIHPLSLAGGGFSYWAKIIFDIDIFYRNLSL